MPVCPVLFWKSGMERTGKPITRHRDVLILSFEDINHCRAVFGNKLCSAVYNPYAGLFYVDDVYGVIEEWDSEN